MLAQRFRDRHEDYAGLREFFPKGRRHRNRVEHRIDGDTALLALRLIVFVVIVALRLHDTGENVLLTQRNAELGVGRQNVRVDLVKRLGAVALFLGRGIIIEVLIVDLRIIDARPGRLRHGQPAAIGSQTPFQHPCRFVLLGGNEAHRVFRQALRGLLGFDVGNETVFVLVDVDTAYLIDGLLQGRHFCSPLRFQGPRVGWVFKSPCKARAKLSNRIGSGLSGDAAFLLR